MKQMLFYAVGLFSFYSVNAQDHLNVMTFNVRYNNPGDSLNAWPYRKDFAASQILFHEAHIIGVQEVLHDQMQDLQQRLSRYKYVGVGREDGKQKGEYSAIFIDTSRLDILKSQTFWLAPETNVPGIKGWDAAITRIVTWAQLKDKKSGKSFYVFNTHFDHMGKIARRESAALLLNKVKEIAGTTPCFVTGDFNARPDDEPVRVLTDKSNAMRVRDSKELSASPHYGPTGTFNGFGPAERDDQPIDYIFIKQGFKVLQHATLSQTWKGRFSSDHFPVFARIEIN